MKCKYCNSLINSGASFCQGCGKSLQELQDSGLVEHINVVQNNEASVPGNDNLELPSLAANNNQQVIQEQSQSFIIPVDEPNIAPIVEPNIIQPIATDNNIDQPEVIKKKKNFMPLVIIMVLIILVSIISISSWYYFSSPKRVFNKIVEDIFLKAPNPVKLSEDLINGTFSFKMNVEDKNENESDGYINELLEIINKITIKTEFGIDYTEKTALLSFDTKYDNTELLKGHVYLNNKKGFIYVNNIYDKYVNTDIDDYDEIFKKKKDFTDEYEIIKDEIQIALTSSLKDKYFTREKIDKMTKSTLVIDTNNYKEIFTNILTYLKNSDKFKQSMSKITETEVSEITDYIKEAIEDIKTDENVGESNVINISVYTEGLKNEIKKVEIANINSEDKYLCSIIINSDTDYEFKYYLDKEEQFSSKITFDTKDNETTMKVNYIYDKTIIDFLMTYSFNYDKKLEKINVSNNKDVDDLTEEDMTKMMENFMEIEGVKKISELFESIYGSISNEVIINSKCSQAFNCTEGENGMMNCEYLGENNNIATVECEISSDDYFEYESEDYDFGEDY